MRIYWEQNDPKLPLAWIATDGTQLWIINGPSHCVWSGGGGLKAAKEFARISGYRGKIVVEIHKHRNIITGERCTECYAGMPQ